MTLKKDLYSWRAGLSAGSALKEHDLDRIDALLAIVDPDVFDATIATASRVRHGVARLKVASCSCITKTPEYRFHADTCPYRILCEAEAKLR